MKELVAENLGGDATDTDRNIIARGFSIQTDLTAGTSVAKSCSNWFTGGVSIALDETAGVSNDANAFNLRYRAGPLDVGLGLQKQKNSVVADERDYRVIAAAYDFGVVRLSGQYQVAEQGNGLEDNEYAIGVTMPLGAFELSAGYAMGKSELSGATTAEGKAFAFGATYALSKRTKLYGGYLDGEVENGVGAVTTDRRLFALGVRHDF